MQVDFYHLTRDPAEKLVPILAGKCLDSNTKVLLVSEDENHRNSLSKALWTQNATSFLAHDFGGSEHEKVQPILISNKCHAPNAATFVILADGQWRVEALDFERAFYLFTEDEIGEARTAWRDLSAKANVTPRYWKQDAGRWVEGP
jgi:DNA polymerase III subunit chi